MYSKVHKTSGATAIHTYLDTLYGDIPPSADGMEFAPPDKSSYFSDVEMPERLWKWLLDIRLLRHIPIAYLVPDIALLPPESIRFFHVNPTWVDRVIDGVLSARQVGTVEAVFRYSLLNMTRDGLDGALKTMSGGTWDPASGMTGMLIRSELAARWPEMTVEAEATADQKKQKLFVFRQEPISKGLWIALIGGVPSTVKLIEPPVGVRYGVEPPDPQNDPKSDFQLDLRTEEGISNPFGSPVTGTFREGGTRRLNVEALFHTRPLISTPRDEQPRMVALHLEQRPYMQVFTSSEAESRGSVPLENFKNADGTFKKILLRKGRGSMTVAALEARQRTFNQMMKEKS